MNEFPSLAYLEREFARLEAQGAAAPAPPLHRRRLVASLVAATVALILVVTPAGAAIVDWIGDLIGIGDPPSRSEESGEAAIVIGVGTAPLGGQFELVATGQAPGGIEQASTCLSIDASPRALSPTGEPLAAASCLTQSALADVRTDKITAAAAGAPPSLAPHGSVLVQGLVTADASSVEVDYRASDGQRRAVPAELAQLTPELASQIELSDEIGYYVAFLPASALGSDPSNDEIATLVKSIEARALGVGRQILGSAKPQANSVNGTIVDLGSASQSAGSGGH